MNTFTLNVDTAETIFDKNEQQNGFILPTTAVPGLRTYRISRERMLATGMVLDYFDFTFDLSNHASGSLVLQEIPYCPSLFSATPTPLPLPITGMTQEKFSGEKFHLLFITPTVESDPAREVPSYINFKRAYTMSGVPRDIKFIYYAVINGQAVRVSSLGNIAFDDQYDADSKSVAIDATKQMSIVTKDNIDYYVIRVSTNPNMVITTGIAKSLELTETYMLDDITYTLKAVSGGTQSWNSATGIRENGFYVDLTVSPPVSLAIGMGRFRVEPAQSLSVVSIVAKSDSEFRFLIRPKVGIAKVDLKIYFLNSS